MIAVIAFTPDIAALSAATSAALGSRLHQDAVAMFHGVVGWGAFMLTRSLFTSGGQSEPCRRGG